MHTGPPSADGSYVYIVKPPGAIFSPLKKIYSPHLAAIAENLVFAQLDYYAGPQVPPRLMQDQKHLCIFRNINARSEILMQVQKH